MKIPFSIKYRPQIESGEYKVETREGKSVRIICWDRKYGFPICGLATEADGHESYVNCYFDGRTDRTKDDSCDLFLITPEPEPLTKLEKAVFDMLVERTNEATISETQARKYGPIFMEIAKDEIYSHESLVEYAEKAKAEGKAEALKDLPRWRKAAGHSFVGKSIMYDEHGFYSADITKPGCRYITCDILAKLPGLNE